MVSTRLEGERVAVNRFDVILTGDEGSNFLKHAAICYEDSEVSVGIGDTITLFEMNPPLQQNQCEVELNSHLLSLQVSEDEVRQIDTFIQERQQERQANTMLGRIREYILTPDSMPPTKEFPMWRFSCVGFVKACFSEADIELLDESSIPKRTRTELAQFYPERSELINDPERSCEFLNLCHGNTFPVSLAGYLYYSFDRPDETIRSTPFQPVEENAFVPQEA